MGELGERSIVLGHVQDVRKNVDVVNPVGIDGENLPELALCSGKV